MTAKTAAPAPRKGGRPPRNPRRADLAKIHIAKKDLGLSDSDYRTMLRSVAGVESSAHLDAAGRKKVLQHLVKCGFKPFQNPPRPPVKKGGGGGSPRRGRPNNMEDESTRAAQLAKIEALLTVGARPWSYADALAKKICGIDKVAWVPAALLYKIITALRKQALREGWDLSGEKEPWT